MWIGLELAMIGLSSFNLNDDDKDFGVSRHALPFGSSVGNSASSARRAIARMAFFFSQRTEWPRRLQTTLCRGLHDSDRARRRALRHASATGIPGCTGR